MTISHTRQILQRLTDAGGAADREDLRLVAPSQCKALSLLKAYGYIVTEHRITDEGRAHLERLIAWAARKPRRALCGRDKQDAAIAAAWVKPSVIETRHPLATTDEQIEKLKRKTEEDRSFGFESINQRGR